MNARSSRRPRREPPPPGLLVVDKPAGWTSHDVVGKVRGLVGTRKVGHAGTLDPMATGVLVLGVERATKLLGHLALDTKTYLATIRLGVETTTDDAEGEPTATADASGVDGRGARGGRRGAHRRHRPGPEHRLRDQGRRQARLRAGPGGGGGHPRGAAGPRGALRRARDPAGGRDGGPRRRRRLLLGHLRPRARPGPRAAGSASAGTSPRCGAPASGRSPSPTRATWRPSAPRPTARRAGRACRSTSTPPSAPRSPAARSTPPGRPTSPTAARCRPPAPRARPGCSGPTGTSSGSSPTRTAGPARCWCSPRRGDRDGGRRARVRPAAAVGWRPMPPAHRPRRWTRPRRHRPRRPEQCNAGAVVTASPRAGAAAWSPSACSTACTAATSSSSGTPCERARELGVPTTLITFDPHPSEVLRPGSHPAQLTTLTRRAELVAELGVDAFWVLPFTTEFAHVAPDEFVHELLVDRLHASAVVVGRNFTYGYKAAGDVAELERLGQRFGFEADRARPRRRRRPGPDRDVLLHLHPAARSRRATWRPPPTRSDAPTASRGSSCEGDQRGRELGYPTANVAATEHAAIPADGVYAGWFVRPRPRRQRGAPPDGGLGGHQPDVLRPGPHRRGVRARPLRGLLRPARRRGLRRPASAGWSASTRSRSSSPRWTATWRPRAGCSACPAEPRP